MKALIIFPVVIFSFFVSLAQCPTAINLTSSGNCLNNSTLQIQGLTNAAKVAWYNNGVLVKSQHAIAGNSATVAAGGNGAGVGANQLSGPRGVFVDKIGSVYVADAENNRVQKWENYAVPNLSVTSPSSIAGSYLAAEALFSTNNRIIKRGPIFGQVIFYNDDATGALHLACSSSANNISGKIALIDRGACSFSSKVKNAQNAGAIAVIIVNNAPGVAPIQMGGVDNSIIIPAIMISFEDGAIFKNAISNNLIISITSGPLTLATNANTVAGGYGSGSAANQLAYPEGLFVDSLGNVYVADNNNHRIQKWIPFATQGITVAGGNGLGAEANQLAYPGSVYVDPLGNIYVADNSNHRIQKWVPGATVGTTVAGGNDRGDAANQLNYPHALFVSNSGDIYVGDDNAKIQKWSPRATSAVQVAGTGVSGNSPSQLNSTSGIFVDPSLAIYASDPINSRVQKWIEGTTDGTTAAGGYGYGGNMIQLANPSGLAVDQDGNVYIADNQNHRIQKWDQQISNSYVPISPGSYTAEITYFNGCIASTNTINIYSSVAPVVKLEYNSLEVNCMNETPIFSVSSNQNLIQPSYQWYKNNVLINGQTSSTYNGRDLVENDSLKCKVTYSNGGCQVTNSLTTPNIGFTRIKQFTFIGNGNWNLSTNWLNGKVPPDPIPCCTKILIDPAVNGECVVASAVRIPSCVDFSVAGNKKLRVIGDLVNKYDSTIIINETVRLPEKTNGTLISTAQELSQGVFKFSYTSTPVSNYSAGNILVGAANNGYIRKVVSSSIQGNTITCQTIPANLEDVFKQGRLTFSSKTDNDLQAAAGINYSFSDVALYENGPLSIKLKNGNISLDPNFNFDFDYKNGRFKYFKTGFTDAVLTGSFQVEVNASQSVTLVDQLDTLKRFSKSFTYWAPVFGVPLIPIVVTMHLDFLCKYSAEVTANIQRTVDFNSSNRATMSLTYKDGAWSPQYSLNSNNSVKMSASTGTAGINVQMAVIPRFSFDINSIDGPYASIGLHEILEGNVASPSLNWDFSAGAFLKTTLGCKTSVLGVSLIDYEREWNTDTIFYKTPHKLEKTSGDNQGGNANQTLPNPIKVRVLDNKNNPQSNVPVYFNVMSGGGQAQPNKVMTNSSGFAETNWTMGQGSTPNVLQVLAKNHSDENFIGSPLTFNANLNNPYLLVKIAGDNQRALPGTSVRDSVKVRVFDINSLPLANIPVSYTVTSGGGNSTLLNAFTDQDGYAQTGWVLGQTNDAPQQMSVSVKNNNNVDVSGSPAFFSATLRMDSLASVSVGNWTNIDNIVECLGFNKSGSGKVNVTFKSAAPTAGTLYTKTSWDADGDGIIDGDGGWNGRDMASFSPSGNSVSFDSGFCWGRETTVSFLEVYYKAEAGPYQSNKLKITIPRP